MSEHISRKEASSRPDDLRLWGRRFRQQCSCGWEAPGWFTHDDTAFHVWCEHVREAKAQAPRVPQPRKPTP